MSNLKSLGSVFGIVSSVDVEPAVLYLAPENASCLLVNSTAASAESGVVKYIEAQWKSMISDIPFEYTTLVYRFEDHYSYIEQMGQMFGLLGILTVFLSCLGLVGLVSYTVERRTREVGIRKVLGAPIEGIIRLLMSEFLVLILLANLIAWPCTYFLLGKFFEYAWTYTNTEISLLHFIFAGMVTLSTTLITILFQTVKAAYMNPVDTLKYE